MQVRAWGLFLNDVCERMADSDAHSEKQATLISLVPKCLAKEPSTRPTFETITAMLRQHLM